MDAKALAKSKRAHSQHHSKKHHPNYTPKAPSAGTVGASSSKKPSGKKFGEGRLVSQGSSALPSNWDRYEQEYGSDSEDPSQDSTIQATGIIKPRSKGADYAHLISEAKSQSQYYSSEGFSFDDVLNDINQGVGSLLSVRGQSILSQLAEDDFMVENKATASHEAPFLSLDLNALAEQLAKADLSKRLFIEADLLPPELCTESQANSRQEFFQGQAVHGSGGAMENPEDSDALVSSVVSEGDKITKQCIDLQPSNTSPTSSLPVPRTIHKGSRSMNQVTDKVKQFGGIDQSTSLKSPELGVNSVADQKKKPSSFEAAAAEAELDMLLNSFSETNIFDSSSFGEKSSYRSTVPQEHRLNSMLEGVPSIQLVDDQTGKKGPDLSKSAMMAVSLDDLLNETSSLMNQNGAPQSHEVKSAAIVNQPSTSSAPVSKSKLLDDFDSWLDTI